MPEVKEDQEWSGLFAQLQGEPEPLPLGAASPFDDAPSRGRVGLLITRAVLGEEQYELHRLYCGEPSLPV